jgi:hypothetical protein
VIRGSGRTWRMPSRAMLLAAAGALLAVAGTFALVPTDTRAAVAPPTLARRLGTSTYGLAIPLSWLAAPIPGLEEDDIVDVFGTRIGERATATEVASGLRVKSVDERALVVELRAVDAEAIAAARARGLTLVPILRSAR